VCICISWIRSCCLRLHIDFRIYFTFSLSAFDYFPGSRDPGVDGWMDFWLQARSFVLYSAVCVRRTTRGTHLLKNRPYWGSTVPLLLARKMIAKSKVARAKRWAPQLPSIPFCACVARGCPGESISSSTKPSSCSSDSSQLRTAFIEFVHRQIALDTWQQKWKKTDCSSLWLLLRYSVITCVVQKIKF